MYTLTRMDSRTQHLRLWPALLLLALLPHGVEARGGLAGRAPELALMLKVLDRPEPAWWERQGAARSGPMHRVLREALGARGIPVLEPGDLAEQSVSQARGAPTDEVAMSIGRGAGADLVLVVELQARKLGELPSLGLLGVQVELSLRLLGLEEEARAGAVISGRAFEEELPVARRRAAELAARRAAIWVKGRIPNEPRLGSTRKDHLLLRVRGVQRLDHLRKVVRRLQDSVGPFWLVGARPGEVLLVGSGEGKGEAAVTAALQGAPFERFGVELSREEGYQVIELLPLAVPEQGDEREVDGETASPDEGSEGPEPDGLGSSDPEDLPASP